MEAFSHIVTLIILALIVATPVVVARKRHGILKSIVFSVVLSAVFVVALYWWNDFYLDFRLEMMGYDFNGMSDGERLKNVPPELRGTASELNLSRFGVGWPVGAMFGIAVTIPYVFLVMVSASLYKRLRLRRANANT